MTIAMLMKNTLQAARQQSGTNILVMQRFILEPFDSSKHRRRSSIVGWWR